jgi:predicted transcriptional regulator
VTRYQKTNKQVRDQVVNSDSCARSKGCDTVFSDGIVCLIDGKKKRNLRKWLVLQYGMTPDEYRRLYNLPDDYPMVIEEKMPTPTATVVLFPKPKLIAKPQVA